MRLALKETRLGLRNSTTRIPFRYGSACLTRCPQAVLRAEIEVGGRRYPFRRGTLTFGHAHGAIYYKEGVLTEFHLDRWAEKSVKFSRKMEGPYYSLPMTKQQMIEAFGKPKKITRSSPPWHWG